MALPRLDHLARKLAYNVTNRVNRKTVLDQANALQAYAAFRTPAHPNGRLKTAKQALFPLFGVSAKYSASIPSLCDSVLWFYKWGVTDISAVAKRSTRTLALDRDSKLEPRAQYFTSLKVPDMPEFLTKYPSMLEWREETIQKGVKFMRYIHITNVGKMLTKAPRVFTYDVENNLKPTYKFLHDTFGITGKDIRNNPVILGYSLNNRIKPRCAYLKMLGTLDNFAASTIICRSDEIFAKNIAKQPLKNYRAFQHKQVQELIEANFA